MRKFEGRIPCVYCSDGISTEGRGDDVIARGFFPESQRTTKFNPILVPACEKCNNSFSSHEQALIALFTLSINAKHPAAKEVATSTVLRSATSKHAKAHYRRGISEIQAIELYSPGGIYITDSLAFQPKYASYDIVFRKIMKGLFYHHFGERFPTDYEIAVFDIDHSVCDQQWETMQRITCNGPFEFANGIFRYSYGYAENDKAQMMWLMSFYNGLYFSVLTSPPKTLGDILELQESIHNLQPGKYIMLDRTDTLVTLSVAAFMLDGSLLPSPKIVQVVPSILAAFRTIDRGEIIVSRLHNAEALLAEVADVEDESQGEFDAVETLRQVREQESACCGHGRRHL